MRASKLNGLITRAGQALLIGLCLGVLPLGADDARAQGFMNEAFIDPTDGWVDASDWLLDKRGFLPVPIIVTEPAVGYGGGAALLFFHRSKAEEEADGEGEGKEGAKAPLAHPPSVSFGFGMGTETKTWAAGGGHFGSWRTDRIRTLTGGGYFSANIDVYLNDTAFPYNLAGFMVSQEVLGRVFDTDLFLGARYRFLQLAPEFGSLPITPPPGALVDQANNAALSVAAAYDSRDNIFTPNSGLNLKVYGNFWRDFFGGDSDFDTVELTLIGYYPFLDERLVVGANFGADFSFGEPPFYMWPYIALRGVPALRYQGERAGQGEIELRWRVWKRFSLIGFTGLGWTDGPLPGSTESGPVPAGGVGFRYLMARLMGLHTGVDFAWSEDTFAFYIQTGGAW